jgi:diguanylate cyclase (GGDEF)-like protein
MRALGAGVVLWLCGLAGALAQDVLPAAALQTAQAPAPIRLGATQQSVPLDRRSRYWIDETGGKTIEEVAAQAEALPWALREPGGQYRLDGRALWLRFEAVVDANQRAYLSMGTSGVDRAQLFHQDATGAWRMQEAGDSRRVSSWPLPGRVPAFELPSRPGEVVPYWVRVEHERVDFASPIALYTQGELLGMREREQFLLGAYFGLAALIAMVALANAVVYRDRSFAAYALYVTVLAVGQLAYLGVGAQHLWDRWLKWNETATFLLPGISAAAALCFVKTVTEPARFSRALDLAVWGLIAAVLSAVALDTLLQSRASFGLVMALTIASMVVVLGLILLVWVQGDDPHIRLVALGFLPVMIMAIPTVLRGLNLIPASAWTRYGISIGAVIEMPILFYALSLRGNRRREAEVRAAALSRNDALTGLAHSRTLLQRLDGALARARSLKHPCALLAVRISNYAAIQEEFGPEAAEKALVVAASHLRRAVSDIDLAARIGEHEFALLLEGPTTVTSALSRAQQVVASGLRQAEALPSALTLKFHVAVAMLPERDLGAAGSLQWVREAAAGMPADARKLIKPINF